MFKDKLVLVAFVVLPFIGMAIGHMIGSNEMWRKMNGHRGKQVRMLPTVPVFDFYKTCKAYYVTGQATSEGNMVVVLLENCEWAPNDTIIDIFDLQDLEPIQ